MNMRDISLRTQALAILAMVAVFASGVVCGIVLDRTLLLVDHHHGPRLPVRIPLHMPPPSPLPPPPPAMPPPLAMPLSPGVPLPPVPFFAELDLTPEQRRQIEAAFERHRVELDQAHAMVLPRVRAIGEQIEREIDQILTPSQRARLRELRSQPFPDVLRIAPIPAAPPRPRLLSE